MYLVTGREMRELDKRAIQDYGIPGVVLMENAGKAAADLICGIGTGNRVAIFCGPGNNGGDGFVIARLLALWSWKPIVFLVASENELKGDALVHFTAFKNCTGSIIKPFEEVVSTLDADSFDVVVDSLLGTGLNSAPRATIATAIATINRLGETLPVVAVDIPSGVSADNGDVPGAVVKAHHTITFAFPKLGHYLYPGAEFVGNISVSDIGFDWRQLTAREGTEPQFRLNDATYFRDLFPNRTQESNKGDYGHVGIIAGSQNMAGAPALTSRAAQRVGAGLVTLLTSAGIQPVIAGKLDEQMTIPLAEHDGAICEGAFETILEFAKRADVLCIGPGITTGPGTTKLINRVVREIDKPMVLDADALNIIAADSDLQSNLYKNGGSRTIVITPHPGEAARLLGTSISEIQSNRIESARRLAEKLQAIVAALILFCSIVFPI